jgi:endonuclease/exonuclease/phosphatase family metal-dependent hydrolase
VKAKPVITVSSKTPFVVGGDFNDVRADLGPKLMEPAGFHRAGRLARTFPAALPARPLDAIFVRGALDVQQCKTSGLKLARSASDHLPLIARLTVRS